MAIELFEGIIVQPSSVLASAAVFKARPAHLAHVLSVIGTDQVTEIFGVGSSGGVDVGPQDVLAAGGQLDVTPNSTATIGVRIQQRAAQSAAALVVTNSANVVQAQISANGAMGASMNTAQQTVIGNFGGVGGLFVGAASDTFMFRSAATELTTNRVVHGSATAAQTALVTKGFTAQSANLFEAQTSASAVVASITAAGTLNAANLVTVGAALVTGNVTSGATVSGANITTTGTVLASGNIAAQNGTANQVVLGNTFGFPVIAFGATSSAVIYASTSTQLTSPTQFIHQAPSAASVVLITQGIAAQTGDLFRAEDSTTATLMAINSAGMLQWQSANQQTTVGAVGGASILPLTPVAYLKVKNAAGTTLVVPAYNP